MAGFNWDDYPVAPPAPTPQAMPAVAPAAPQAAVAAPAAFNWDDHPVVGNAPPAQMPGEAPSGTEALLRGGVQGVTMGFGDEAQGGVQALYDKLLGSDGGKGIGDLYSQHTAEARAANEAAQKAHPYLYGTGNVAGGIGAGVLTGGLGAETALGRIGASAAMGAAGGVGFGNASDASSGAADALKGAITGGVVGSAVEGISSALAPTNLETFAANRSAAALGADKAAIRRMGADKVQQLGRNALDEGIVTPFTGTQTMMDRAGKLMNKGAEGMNSVYSALDEAGAGAINPSELAETVDSTLSPAYRTPINKGEWSQVDNTVESILARGEAGGNSEIPLAEAQALKNEIGQVAYPKGRTVNPDFITPKQQMAQDAWSVINDAIDEAAARGAKTLNAPEIAEKLQASKDQFGTGKGALNLLGNRAAKEQGNNFFSLGDQMAAGAGYIAKGPAGLAAMGVKKAILNPYGNGTVAAGADKLADVVRSAPHLLGPWAEQLTAAEARGGVSLGITNMILNQTNQQYREHMKSVFGGNK